MRILHTSDWHLGRSFGPVSLHEHQVAFADWLVGVVQDQHVDLVVVAGDVYDRAVPPVASIELFDATLLALHEAGATVVVVAGNHDSAERVTVYDRLVERAGIHVRGGHGRAGETLLLSFADGPLAVAALPYLDPALAPSTPTAADAAGPDCEPGRLRRPSHEELVRRALARSADAVVGTPRSLAVAHAFVVSGALWPVESDSERSLSLGGSAAVDAAVFETFSYTALGHLHAPQAVGRTGRARYSGSPLPYSFGETQQKSVTVVDMGPAGEVDIEVLAVPEGVGRRVATITGTLDELLITPQAHVADRFVRARLTDAGPVLDARQRLQAVYPFIVEVELRPSVSGTGVGDLDRGASRRALDPLEVATGYWNDLYGDGPADAEARLIAEALLEAQAR